MAERSIMDQADELWAERLSLFKVPADQRVKVWDVIEHRIWKAARAILKEERLFRPRKLKEYPKGFHQLIEAQVKMLHAAGWRWKQDERGKRQWVQIDRDGKVIWSLAGKAR